MRVDVLQVDDWFGKPTEHGSKIYGWHFGTVCMYEHALDDGTRFEVYVSHPQVDGSAVVVHWSVHSDRERAKAQHESLVRQLKDVGEHGMFAVRFET